MDGKEQLNVKLDIVGLESGEIFAKDMAKFLNGLQRSVYGVQEYVLKKNKLSKDERVGFAVKIRDFKSGSLGFFALIEQGQQLLPMLAPILPYFQTVINSINYLRARRSDKGTCKINQEGDGNLILTFNNCTFNFPQHTPEVADHIQPHLDMMCAPVRTERAKLITLENPAALDKSISAVSVDKDTVKALSNPARTEKEVIQQEGLLVALDLDRQTGRLRVEEDKIIPLKVVDEDIMKYSEKLGKRIILDCLQQVIEHHDGSTTLNKLLVIGLH